MSNTITTILAAGGGAAGGYFGAQYVPETFRTLAGIGAVLVGGAVAVSSKEGTGKLIGTGLAGIGAGVIGHEIAPRPAGANGEIAEEDTSRFDVLVDLRDNQAAPLTSDAQAIIAGGDPDSDLYLAAQAVTAYASRTDEDLREIAAHEAYDEALASIRLAIETFRSMHSALPERVESSAPTTMPVLERPSSSGNDTVASQTQVSSTAANALAAYATAKREWNAAMSASPFTEPLFSKINEVTFDKLWQMGGISSVRTAVSALSNVTRLMAQGDMKARKLRNAECVKRAMLAREETINEIVDSMRMVNMARAIQWAGTYVKRVDEEAQTEAIMMRTSSPKMPVGGMRLAPVTVNTPTVQRVMVPSPFVFSR